MKPGESLIERHRIESKLGPAAQNDLRAANSPGLQRAPNLQSIVLTPLIYFQAFSG
jgi:hypothetical protein